MKRAVLIFFLPLAFSLPSSLVHREPRQALAFDEYPYPLSCGTTQLTRSGIATNVTHSLNRKFPWMVAIINSKNQFCSGSLIDNIHILTAANCLTKFRVDDITTLRVYLGEEDVPDGDFEIRGVKKTFKHRGYSKSKKNDVGILVLDAPVQFGTYIQPICLYGDSSTPPFQRPGAEAIFAGWGTLQSKGVLKSFTADIFHAQQVFEMELNIRSNKNCTDLYMKYGNETAARITDNVICAGATSEDSEDLCKGDVGGPLMMKIDNTYQQIGILSWGVECNRFPAIFTRVDKYLGWIISKTEPEKSKNLNEPTIEEHVPTYAI